MYVRTCHVGICLEVSPATKKISTQFLFPSSEDDNNTDNPHLSLLISSQSLCPLSVCLYVPPDRRSQKLSMMGIMGCDRVPTKLHLQLLQPHTPIRWEERIGRLVITAAFFYLGRTLLVTYSMCILRPCSNSIKMKKKNACATTYVWHSRSDNSAGLISKIICWK